MVWGPWLKVYFMVVSSAQEGDPLQQTSENVLLWLPLGNESTKNWRKKIQVKTDPKDSVGRKVQSAVDRGWEGSVARKLK